MARQQPLLLMVPGQTRTEYVTREVHEHRAPTDQSVALLKEMEAAARERIVEAVKVGDSQFECVVHFMRDAASYGDIARAVFSLNGKKMRAEYRPQLSDGPNEWAIGLRDAIAQEIATHVLMSALNGLAFRK